MCDQSRNGKVTAREREGRLVAAPLPPPDRSDPGRMNSAFDHREGCSGLPCQQDWRVTGRDELRRER